MITKKQPILALTMRNCKQYFRDKSTVFFSLLSMIIVIALMLFFLGENLQNTILQFFEKIPNRDIALDAEHIKQFVFFWSCGGILSVNSVTVAIGVYSGLLNDQTSGKINALYVAPIKKSTVAISYVAAAWLASILVGVATFVGTEIIGVILGYPIFSAATHLKVMGIILLSSFVYASILYCIALLVKNSGAWSGMATIVGTLVGFLGGIYLPVGALEGAVASVMKWTPALYSAALFRSVLCETSLGVLFEGLPAKSKQEMAVYLGNVIEVFGKPVSATKIVIGLLLVGIVFLGISVLLLRKRKTCDR